MVTPEYGEPVLRTGALEVERWRIRSLQEEDPELNPYIVLYEKGATELRKLYGQKTAELTMRHQEDFKMSDGILGRWIHLPGGGSRLVMAVPEGGNRAITVNGKRHVLSWRAWMLHHAHNTAAGGHVGAGGVENKILTV
jgi:hypothetical protein